MILRLKEKKWSRKTKFSGLILLHGWTCHSQVGNIGKGPGYLQMVDIINLVLYYVKFEMTRRHSKEALGYTIWHPKKSEMKIFIVNHLSLRIDEIILEGSKA